ncbi:MAG TPA: hypothetical protein VN798_15310, partial [Pseudomonas sp.]|nr:hypothetical protein [Pseudomonas sp.]
AGLLSATPICADSCKLHDQIVCHCPQAIDLAWNYQTDHPARSMQLPFGISRFDIQIDPHLVIPEEMT